MTSPPLEAVDVKVDVTGLEDRTRVVEDVLVGAVVPWLVVGPADVVDDDVLGVVCRVEGVVGAGPVVGGWLVGVVSAEVVVGVVGAGLVVEGGGCGVVGAAEVVLLPPPP